MAYGCLHFERHGDVEFVASHLCGAIDDVGDLRTAFDDQHQVNGLLPICVELDGDVGCGVRRQVNVVGSGLQCEGDLISEVDGCLEFVCNEGEAVWVVDGEGES